LVVIEEGNSFSHYFRSDLYFISWREVLPPSVPFPWAGNKRRGFSLRGVLIPLHNIHLPKNNYDWLTTYSRTSGWGRTTGRGRLSQISVLLFSAPKISILLKLDIEILRREILSFQKKKSWPQKVGHKQTKATSRQKPSRHLSQGQGPTPTPPHPPTQEEQSKHSLLVITALDLTVDCVLCAKVTGFKVTSNKSEWEIFGLVYLSE
jgi:hypothetical protein